MAAAALVVSATSSTCVGAGVKSQRLSRFGPKSLSFASWKRVHIVRCDAEDGEAKEVEEEGVKKTISKLDNLLSNDAQKKLGSKAAGTDDSQKKLGFGTSTKPVTTDATESAAPTEGLDFDALFALDGPVLEILSGRLAMFGMAFAFWAEKVTGLTVFEQVFTRGFTGLVFFSGAVQLLTYASVKPITKGESMESRSLGPFTPRAERWNGRLAMVGFLMLIVTEALRHAPLFQ